MQRNRRGFSILELLVVVAIILIVAVLGLPSLSRTQAVYRASGDGRAIAETLALAKMKAGSNFTREQLFLDTNGNTYYLQQCVKSAATTGALVDTCTSFQPDGSPQYLSPGVSFGFAGITTPVLGGSQTTIAQTSPLTFNSQGIPVDSNNNPSSVNTIYYNNSAGYFAVTAGLSGRIQTWKWDAGNSVWVAQ